MITKEWLESFECKALYHWYSSELISRPSNSLLVHVEVYIKHYTFHAQFNNLHVCVCGGGERPPTAILSKNYKKQGLTPDMSRPLCNSNSGSTNQIANAPVKHIKVDQFSIKCNGVLINYNKDML